MHKLNATLIVIKAPKPRNPTHGLLASKRCGAHGKTGKALRTADRAKLRKEAHQCGREP